MVDLAAQDAGVAAGEVGRALTDALGEDVVAVYLHGSAALGGFRWDRSDLDILALSRSGLSDDELRRAVLALGALDYPANGLEFSLMTAAEAIQPAFPAPRFQLHMTTGGGDRAGKVVDGRARDGDPDLTLHLAVCRAGGIAIVGPLPRLTLAEVPEASMVSAMRDEVRWARKRASLEYLVLTAARLWLFAETGRISSKVEAGEWAEARFDEPSVIERALARRGGAEVEIQRAAAERLADRAEMAGVETLDHLERRSP
jgi:Domain of unknown function (DUF4111)